MRDLSRPALMYMKAAMLLLAGSVAAALLVLRSPDVTTALLVAIAVWAFCRVYYFAFYVVEHYIDDSFRFSGLLSVVKYVLTRSGARSQRPRWPPDRP